VNRSFIGLIVGALTFSVFYWVGMLAHDSTVVHEDRFDGVDSWLARNVSDPPRWPVGSPLVLGAGQEGHLVYDLSLPPEAHLAVRVACADVPGLEARLRLLSAEAGEQREADWPLAPGVNEIDLSAHVPADGLVRIALEARMPLGATPQAAFGDFAVTMRFPRALHWGALIFFFVAGALVWVGGSALVIFEAHERGLGTRPVWAVAALAVAGAALLVPTHEWPEGRESMIWGRKLFDDVRALSNASLMVANGGDTSQLYFRSRERPGYLAQAIPLALVFPQQLIRAQFAPSDFHEQMWREFDRRGATFGTFRQSGVSTVAWLEGIACALVWALIWRRLGCGAGAAWLAALLGALAVAHVLYNPLTILWNLLINALAVLATLRLFDQATARRALMAGTMLGLAALTKTTAITSFLPLAVLFVGRLRAPAPRRPLFGWGAAALLVATALVLWWYDGLMQGLITELRRHPADFPRIMELHPEFPRRSWHTALAVLWALAGPGWILVALGLTLGARGWSVRASERASVPAWRVSREAWTFGLLWALAGLTAFVMPFLFPRFFKYMAPGLGLLAAAGTLSLAKAQRRRGGSAAPSLSPR
jgi:hypothetical protein